MSGKKYTIRIFIACLILQAVNASTTAARAQGKPPLEYQIKAAFLFNFTRFIHWPASAYSSPDAPFVIGIAGNDPFGSYLDDLVNGEQAEGHNIIIRRYPDGGDISGCQLLFVNTFAPAKLKTILSLARRNTLTVGDANSFVNSGGMIRFFKEDNRIKMEIKLAAIKAAKLEISAKLLQVAKVK
ncbi:YfiR family protein [Mucilaginibacter panaciglaebae]|uniref:YfiR family protein n=1 Tax=Mucilaginibacter panaciglaebae TaxID=502331 RepID=A0ABP7X1V9_9SPHI